MGSKYTRVRDKTTGHEYDVLTHRLDEDKHELADQERWPPSAQPRAPRHNVKGPRPRNSGGSNAKPAENAKQPDAATGSADTVKPPRKRTPRPSKTTPAS